MHFGNVPFPFHSNNNVGQLAILPLTEFTGVAGVLPI